MTSEEYFDLIEDASSGVIGRATRKECHGNPALLHRSIRVLILHPDGKRMLLQKRALSKDVFPGRWDMAVGGHVDSGETPLCTDHHNKTLEECRALGVNDSMIHEDFMIGCDTMNIDATTRDGKVIPIFRAGNWAF